MAGYLILSILCSPCSSGVSKQYLRVTPLHLNMVISLNLFLRMSSSSVYTLVRSLFYSSYVKVPRALPLTLGRAYMVLSMPLTLSEQETKVLDSGCQTFPNRKISDP